MGLGRFLAVVLVAGAPLLAAATDAPHDASQGSADCQGCHFGHNAQGASLTSKDGNFTLCQSCHSNYTRFGFPWNDTDQATPGVGGRSHRWDALATNYGATAPDPNSTNPAEAAMGKRLDGGKLQCSTCHDQHQADIYRGTPRITVPLNTSIAHTGASTGTLQLTSVPANANAAGYVIKISAANAFKISHDGGISFFGYNNTLTPKWAAESTTGYSAGYSFTPPATVPLDDGVTLVTFGSGTFVAGDQFASFYISYPFLRADNTDSKMCLICHKDRDLRWQDVEGASGGKLGTNIQLGTTVFSHPVGNVLGANGHAYDRTAVTMLDADGTAQQGGTEGNTTNDLRLGTGGIVHCMTCHHPHNADSNSTTTDPR